jgi:hypothetical protein
VVSRKTPGGAINPKIIAKAQKEFEKILRSLPTSAAGLIFVDVPDGVLAMICAPKNVQGIFRHDSATGRISIAIALNGEDEQELMAEVAHRLGLVDTSTEAAN